ncbi:MAG TPA: exodeoxyribonuclease V subunit gamma, partial [Rhodanobacter sp.]
LVLAPLEAAAGRAATRWRALDAHYPLTGESRGLHAAAHGLAVEDTLDDLREGDGSQRIRLMATASTVTSDKKLRHDKLLAYWVAHLLVNANAVAATTCIVAPDALVQLPPLDAAEAKHHLDALLAAVAEGMRAPLPIARKTAFAWLLTEAANQGLPPEKQKNPYANARKRYDHDEGEHGHGEVDEEPALARTWPDFAAMHGAGFERWLHLYRPLLDAARVLDDAA